MNGLKQYIIPGMPPRKMYNLFTKRRKYSTVKHQDVLWPSLSEEILGNLNGLGKEVKNGENIKEALQLNVKG